MTTFFCSIVVVMTLSTMYTHSLRPQTLLMAIRCRIKGFRCSSMDAAPESTLSHKSVQPGHIYFVATPIGNLDDITKRAVDVLSHVDIICAEDTRHTKGLLRHLNLGHKTLLAHHEYNHQQQIPKIMSMAKLGKSFAIVSDAGTPGISDPGAELADACQRANIPIHPVPGPSAVISALCISGFSSSSFSFHGFVPVKGKERSEKLLRIASSPDTTVFFEAPHRIKETFLDLSRDFEQGQRQCICCREITKLHEEFVRGTVDSCYIWLENFKEDKDRERILGEFTIVMGPMEPEFKSSGQIQQVDIEETLLKLKADGETRSEAVKITTKTLSVAKAAVYKIALSIQWT